MSTTVREDVVSIDKEMNEVEEDIVRLQDSYYRMQDHRNKLIFDVIKEERLFQNTTWDLYFVDELYLVYDHGDKSNPNMDKLEELCFPKYEGFRKLTPSIEIRNGSCISLHFDHDKISIKDFIKEHGLKVNGVHAQAIAAKYAANILLINSIVNDLKEI